MNYKFPGMCDGCVNLRGRSTDYEHIMLLHHLEWGFNVTFWNFRMACGKSKSHMDDLILFLSGKFHRFGCDWDDCLSAGKKSKNPFLEIESQHSCIFRIQY